MGLFSACPTQGKSHEEGSSDPVRVDDPSEKEPIMLRSVAVLLALLILPRVASAQEPMAVPGGSHEVVKGETLWALAEQYLGDPFRWPLIFEANRDRIEDPHWIYPHQMLVIPGLEGPPAEAAEVTDVAVVAPGQEPQAMPQPMIQDLPPCPGASGRTIFYPGETDTDRGCVVQTPPADQRTAFYIDPSEIAATFTATSNRAYFAVPRGIVYSTPWLEPWGAEGHSIGTIGGFAEVDMDRTHRTRASTYEKVRLDIDDGVQLRVGDLLQAFTIGREDEMLGQVVRPTGILAVTAIEDGGVVGMISAEFDRVDFGQYLRPAPDFTLEKGVLAQEVESNLYATVLGFNKELVIYGLGSVAFLDVGEDQGVTQGDEFMAYVNQEGGWSGGEAVRLQVVLVEGGVASVRVINVTEPILKTGTRVRLVRKMD